VEAAIFLLGILAASVTFLLNYSEAKFKTHYDYFYILQLEEESPYENLALIYFVIAHKTETQQIILRKNKLRMKWLPIQINTFFLNVFLIIF